MEPQTYISKPRSVSLDSFLTQPSTDPLDQPNLSENFRQRRSSHTPTSSGFQNIANISLTDERTSASMPTSVMDTINNLITKFFAFIEKFWDGIFSRNKNQ